MWIFIVSCLVVLGFPALFTLPSFLGIKFSKTGEIGDTIGGILGPFIGIIAAFLTFIAFWVQFKANEQHRTDISKQDAELKAQQQEVARDRFEGRFYKYIGLHRANVEEMIISEEIRGHKCFTPMVYELRYIYKLIEEMVKQEKTKIVSLQSKEDQIDLAYKIFFYGTGYNSELQLKYFLSPEEASFFDEHVKPALRKLQKAYKEKDPQQPSFMYPSSNNQDITDWRNIELFYCPFDGHSSRLGHYFRFLFQCVKYVDNLPDSTLSWQDKTDYLSMLRSQLSNPEQMLLYYNALSDIGAEWLNRSYLKKYKFVHNLPISLCDFGPHPYDKIGQYDEQGKHMFEWDRVAAKR